jgi:methylated-DNA-protein-cysteine methyltransferase related protein
MAKNIGYFSLLLAKNIRNRTLMATSSKKNKPAKTKAAAGPVRKAPKAPKKAATKNSKPAGKTSAREKLIAIRPSGSRDDSFFDLVHEVARQIPEGRVTSYGAIAACLGTRMSARLVGWAMLSAPNTPKPVPAHRVVNRNGLLTGKHHYNPPGRMQQLLEKEGVVVKDDKVVDFKKLFWDPAQEL